MTTRNNLAKLQEREEAYALQSVDSARIAPNSYGHGYDEGRRDGIAEAIRILTGQS